MILESLNTIKFLEKNGNHCYVLVIIIKFNFDVTISSTSHAVSTARLVSQCHASFFYLGHFR